MTDTKAAAAALTNVAGQLRDGEIDDGCVLFDAIQAAVEDGLTPQQHVDNNRGGNLVEDTCHAAMGAVATVVRLTPDELDDLLWEHDHDGTIAALSGLGDPAAIIAAAAARLAS